MNLLTIFTKVTITAISFNGKYNELRISHGEKHLRSITLDKPELVPFVITYNPALRSISSVIRKHFHIKQNSYRAGTTAKG